MSWSWRTRLNPKVDELLRAAAIPSNWEDQLETLASDSLTGKVLCVVAGAAIARSVVATEHQIHESFQEALEKLDLVERWIDDPTEERFEEMVEFLFGYDCELPESGPWKIVWAALRVATSSIGNFEAGWALGLVTDDAAQTRVDAFAVARTALISRAI